MADNDYDDELPAISVNCMRDSVGTSLPGAAAVAAERRRAEECERELAALAEREASSGSEDSAVLAAAVAGLIVEPLVQTSLQTLLEPLSALLPPELQGFLPHYLHAVAEADQCQADALFYEILSDMISILVCPLNTFTDTDVISSGAWLMCMCGSTNVGVQAMQAIYYLLNEVATKQQVIDLCSYIERCGWDTSTLLRVSDCVRAGGAGGGTDGGGGGGRLAADLLLGAAAMAALGTESSGAVADVSGSGAGVCVWAARGARGARGGAAHAQEAALQVAARALTHCARTDEEREELLSALSELRPARPRSPDRLKVAVGVSKVQLLFRNNT